MSWERWWRRRSPFSRIFEEMEQMMRELDEMFSRSIEEFEKEFPRELIREKKLKDGSTIREFGPIIYGYSIKIGPDGKPEIREFGNIRPRGRPEIVELTETREPLVDVFEEDDTVKVVAEVPGVEKEDINLNATEDMLIISVKTPQRKYYKEVELPAKVDPNSAKASYKNGVLEVTLKKKEGVKEEKGVKIKVE
ncbi:MAG: archaeal heat shock protein Hsp20 [Nitrososphaerota archaeon]|nr:Hsp20/alpha crystallin family protein [Candidatus Geocrenenecus dongiae]